MQNGYLHLLESRTAGSVGRLLDASESVAVILEKELDLFFGSNRASSKLVESVGNIQNRILYPIVSFYSSSSYSFRELFIYKCKILQNQTIVYVEPTPPTTYAENLSKIGQIKNNSTNIKIPLI